MISFPNSGRRKFLDSYVGILHKEVIEEQTKKTILEAVVPQNLEAKLNIIVPYLSKKTGKPLYRYGGEQGFDEYTNEIESGIGVRYIFDDGKQVRFNFGKSGEILTVDIWSGTVRTINKIDAQVDVKGLSIISLLPFIVDMLKRPVVKHFNEVPFDPEVLNYMDVKAPPMSEAVLTEAIEVKIDGKSFDSKGAAKQYISTFVKEH